MMLQNNMLFQIIVAFHKPPLNFHVPLTLLRRRLKRKRPRDYASRLIPNTTATDLRGAVDNSSADDLLLDRVKKTAYYRLLIVLFICIAARK